MDKFYKLGEYEKAIDLINDMIYKGIAQYKEYHKMMIIYSKMRLPVKEMETVKWCIKYLVMKHSADNGEKLYSQCVNNLENNIKIDYELYVPKEKYKDFMDFLNTIIRYHNVRCKLTRL